MIQANGTDAKDVAIHFINLTNTRATPHIMGKTIVQAKSLLSYGYTKEEVIEVLDYVILVKKKNVFSLGYISASINDCLREINENKEKEELNRQKEEVKNAFASQPVTTSEVKVDDESKERNRQKAERIRANIQSRKREKYSLDMFEGQ